MQRVQVDPDLASLAVPEKLRMFLQTIREGGEIVEIRNGTCWRGSVRLDDCRTKGTA